MKQLSGFMAIEGISPLQELVELYRSFCDPTDRGVKLVHDMAFENIPALLDEDGDPISVTDELWHICLFFRLHLGMAVAVEKHAVSEWYYNPADGVHQKNYNVNAHYASELYLRLQVMLFYKAELVQYSWFRRDGRT